MENLKEKTPVQETLFQRSYWPKKETPTQVFSCEFLDTLKNSFLKEHLLWLLLKKRKEREALTIARPT